MLFTFERQWKDSNPYHKVSGGGYDYFGDMGFNEAAGVDRGAVDDDTVRFTLTEPQAPFLADVAMDFASIQSKEYADALLKLGKPELIDQEPIGTGPFELVQYQKDATIRYRPFAGYWGPKPKIDALVFSINKDPAVRLAKLRANECQVMAFPNLADLPAIKADADLQLMEQPGLNIGYLAFNNQKKPFTDKRVRIAINMAIDKQAILQAVYQGAGQPAKNLIPPTMWSLQQPDPGLPARSRRGEEAAGRGRLSRRLRDRPVGDAGAAPIQPRRTPHRRADAVRSREGRHQGQDRQLRVGRIPQARPGRRAPDGASSAGPATTAIPTTSSCRWPAVPRRDPAAAVHRNGAIQEFDALINKAATLTDQAERAKLYEQAQVIMHQEAPFFLIAHSIVFMPMRKDVIGYKMSPFGRHQFDTVDLK